MKSNNYRIVEEDSFFVRTPNHSNVINMLGSSYCSHIMTKFNFEVLNVDIFFFFVKNAVLGYFLGESAHWWDAISYYTDAGEISISKKGFLKDSN